MATMMGVPHSGADNDGVGTLAWNVSANGQYVDDSNYDTATLGSISTVQTHYDFQTNFTNFSTIPVGATINSITLDLVRFRSGLSTGTVKDAVIQYLVNGAVAGVNKADVETDWESEVSVQYVWNTGMPTRDQVAAANFGIAISATLNKTGGTGNLIANIDYLSVTIDYTEETTFKPIVTTF